MSDVVLNKNGTNAKIKVNLLSDEEMRRIGFTDHREGYWYFMRMLKCLTDTSFNVSINKEDATDLKIDVLDEGFLQPYDYQYFLSLDSGAKNALAVKREVEEWMMYLVKFGVITNYNVGDYI